MNKRGTRKREVDAAVEHVRAQAERERQYRAEEEKFYQKVCDVAERAHKASFKADPYAPWHLYYKIGGFRLQQDSPGPEWKQGPEIKVAWLTKEQVITRVRDAVRTLPVLPLD